MPGGQPARRSRRTQTPPATGSPASTGNRRDQRRCRTINRILDGAFSLFLECGFHGTSMDRISQQTGISKPTIYNYFHNKEALFTAIIRRATDTILQIIHGPPRKNQSIETALYRFALNYADTVLAPEMISLHRLVLGEAQRFPALGSLYYDSGYLISERGLEQYLHFFAKRGDLAIADFEDAANDFWELVLGYLHTYQLCNPSKKISKKRMQSQIMRGIRNFLSLYGTRQRNG